MLQSDKLHVVDVVLLRLFCGWCRARFFLCRSCYRGEGYCGEVCRKASRLAIRRRAEARYRRWVQISNCADLLSFLALFDRRHDVFVMSAHGPALPAVRDRGGARERGVRKRVVPC